MCAEARRLLGRRGRVPEHRLAVASALGVVGEARQVGCSVRRSVSASEHRAVEREAPRRRQRLLDGDARQLVSERDAPSSTATSTPVARHSSTESDASPQTAIVSAASSIGGATAAASTTATGRRAQMGDAGEHGVAHRRRDVLPPAASTSVT